MARRLFISCIQLRNKPDPRGKSLAQGMVEFALILPILLALIFGIIEFGRLFQAWLSVQNAARFGERYAVTGNYDVSYCPAADAALGGYYSGGDAYGAGSPAETHDCKVPYDYQKYMKVMHGEIVPDPALLTAGLEDRARIPSIKDAALAGALAISRTPTALDGQAGYFQTIVCVYRDTTIPPDGSDWVITPNPLPNHSASCLPNEDPGQGGEVVRVQVEFNHPLMTPFLRAGWNMVHLVAEREGAVETFRTARAINVPQGFVPTKTATPTSTITSTYTYTPTKTLTPTNTVTLTPTITATPCANNGTGLEGDYYQWKNGDLSNNYFYNPRFSHLGENINFDWTTGSPAGLNADRYAIRWTGKVMPLFTESFTFFANTDDGVRVWVNGGLVIDNWNTKSASDSTSSAISLTACQKYDIKMEYFESTGSASAKLYWQSASQAKAIIPVSQLFYTANPPPTSTATITPTLTLTPTITLTPTKTLTPTITLTPTRTLIPTITLTPTKTLVPSLTPIPPTSTTRPSRTPTQPPTNTLPPTATLRPTNTVPPTATHTQAPTRTPTVTPTKTYVPTGCGEGC